MAFRAQEIAKLFIRITSDNTQAIASMSATEKRAMKLQNAMNVAKNVIVYGSIAAIGAITAMAKTGVKEWNEQANAMAQVANRIEMTGGAAGYTAVEIGEMASSLQDLTTFSDDAVLAGQEMLLTFTQIGKETFPRATETMLDMATVFKTDAKNAAIQLGKALNDPILGISALSRVGVKFTEQQKSQIKAMMDVNDVAGAQKIILDELAVETGGAAAAAATTLSGKMIKMKNAFGDAAEGLGKKLQPALMDLADYLTNDFKPIVEGTMTSLGYSIGGLISDVISGLKIMTGDTSVEIDKQKKTYYGVGYAIELVFNTMQNIVIVAGNVILGVVSGMARGILLLVEGIIGGVGKMMNATSAIMGFLHLPTGGIDKAAGAVNNFSDTIGNLRKSIGSVGIFSNLKPIRTYAQYVANVDKETKTAEKSTNKYSNSLNTLSESTDNATEAAEKEAEQLKENISILNDIGEAIKNSLINNIEAAYTARESLFENYSKSLEKSKNQQINDETFIYNYRVKTAESEYISKKVSLDNQIDAIEYKKDAAISAIGEEESVFNNYVDLQLSRIDEMERNRKDMINTTLNAELGVYNEQIERINELIGMENKRYQDKQKDKTLQNLRDQIDLEDNLYKKQQLINQYNETVGNYQRQDKIDAWTEEQNQIKEKIELTKESAKADEAQWAAQFDMMREGQKSQTNVAAAGFERKRENALMDYGYDTNEINLQIEELDKTYETFFSDLETGFTNTIATIESVHAISIQMLEDELNIYKMHRDELLNEESLTAMIVNLFTSGDYVRYINENIPKLKNASKSIGEAIVEGMGLGLQSEEEIRKFADQVINNLKSDLQIHSPSKRSEPVGEATGEGFAIGMYNAIPDVIASGSTLSDAALGALASSVAEAGAIGKGFTSDAGHSGAIMSGGVMSSRPSWDVSAGKTSSGEEYTMTDWMAMDPILRNSGANFRTTLAMINGEIAPNSAVSRYNKNQNSIFGGQVTNNIYTQNVDQQTMSKITDTTTTKMAMETSV